MPAEESFHKTKHVNSRALATDGRFQVMHNLHTTRTDSELRDLSFKCLPCTFLVVSNSRNKIIYMMVNELDNRNFANILLSS